MLSQASQIPLLIVSDSPNSPTGLGRITRDLAMRSHWLDCDEEVTPAGSLTTCLPLFRVATLGLGGGYTRNLPFAQYQMAATNGLIPNNLPEVWHDFAGSTRGIILAIGNPTWLTWLSHPETLPESSELRAFLESKPFDKWIYAPIDGDGPTYARLPGAVVESLRGWDRVLAYNQYGARLIDLAAAAGADPSTTPAPLTEYLPHGIDTGVFFQRDRALARRTFMRRIAGAGQLASPFTPDARIDDDMFLVGVVATNSERKDWYLAMEVCEQLLRRGANVVLWGHTDGLQKYWNLRELATDLNMGHRCVFTTRALTDTQMAWGYSACDITLGIGSGEGFGFPIAESLACGCPVIHGNYAGAADYVPSFLLVDPVAFRGDGYYGIRRPVYRADAWASRALQHSKTAVALPDELAWENLWPRWEKWLREGVQQVQQVQ